MRAKRIGIILISLLLIADISGCENLKKKDALPAAKTEESEVYHGFDDLNQDDPKTAQESVLKENGMVCAGGKIEAGEKNWEKFREATGEKKPVSIRIMQKITDGAPFYRDVIYDGTVYRMVISVDPTRFDYTYKNLLVLEGKRTDESVTSRLVVLTDREDLTFEEVIESEGNSDSEKRSEYQLIFRD
ncbi:hypothetical protein KGMB01110_27810 [Mediterraneibacter butyricigenes]|uniref:Uncharacterized protein n=1 Tax=Mediterraneibacter butyricigenes TaxID=2316025 RepID=A0A391P3Z0_9FIRM|nr:hypothetical protein [Mediterraneibacter butyricigenes]RGO28308.1 hypothetical protein DXB23_03045 [Dorea sp. OM02-2LB]GCA68345.1 hypothetical protein KGMB01110_27810 [Mediterraneibacter butyricigenes]